MITAVIPVYNGAKTIKRTVQSLNHDKITQIICVDDGSTDDSVNQIQQLISDYPVQLLKQNNRGPAAARNRGIQSINNDYVLFVDSDDLITENAIDDYITAMETYPDCDVYIGKIAHLTNEGIKEIQTYAQFPAITMTTLNESPFILQSIGPGGKLYKYECIKNLQFNDSVIFCEEHEFNIHVFKDKVCVFDNIVYLYDKTNSQSITGRSNDRLEQYLKDAYNVRMKCTILLENNNNNVKDYYSYRMDLLIIFYLIKNTMYQRKITINELKWIHNYLISALHMTELSRKKIYDLFRKGSAYYSFIEYKELTGQSFIQYLLDKSSAHKMAVSSKLKMKIKNRINK